MTNVNPFVSLAKHAAVDLSQQASAAGQSDIMRMGLTALGVGAAARGAMGLADLIKRHTSPPRPKYPQAIVTRVPVPVEDDVDDPTKAAAVTAKDGFPWYYPGMALAGGVGLVGGWKGVDFLLEKQRNMQREQELNSAKRDFEDALVSSYGQPRQMKTAGDELGKLLDDLFDGVQQKQAEGSPLNPLNWISDDNKGRMAGLYGAYALATGVPAALWQYGRSSANSRGATLDKAMKLRSRRAYMSRPSEIYAVPEPVLRRRPAPAEDAADLAEAEGEPTLEGNAPLQPAPRRRVDFL